MKKRYFDLIRAWAHEYFKHPLENLRTAKPVVPGRIYTTFGNICKAVPMSAPEKAFIDNCPSGALPAQLLFDIRKEDGDSIKFMSKLYVVAEAEKNIPPKCNLCDFYKYSIPCPVYNVLKNGNIVCDTHKYTIIKHATNG